MNEDKKDLRNWVENIREVTWSGLAMRTDQARTVLTKTTNAIEEILKQVISFVDGYQRGDFVQVRRPNSRIGIALIHDQSDLSPGNYRGTIIKRGLSSEITILAADIIGKAPADFKITEAQAKTFGILTDKVTKP